MKRRATTGDKAGQARRRKVANPERKSVPAAVSKSRSSDADLQKQLDQRTRELAEARRQLAEALEQQTATSEVLQVISRSPGELEPVFNAVLANATRLCDAKFGNLFLFREGKFYPTAMLDAPPALAAHIRKNEWQGFVPDPGVGLGRILRTKSLIHVLDDRLEPHPGPASRYGGARSLVAVPMVKDDELVGAFVIYRQEVRAFTDKQIELVQNFAAQAVIAIENTRLLNELRLRTDDLTEALEQQTATSEVLKVISSSPGQLQPVFQAMLANAVRICEAGFGVLHRFEDGLFCPAAVHDIPPALAEFQRQRGG
jgi:transcriptional regulator with GAF, ATPase, and Fis domain